MLHSETDSTGHLVHQFWFCLGWLLLIAAFLFGEVCSLCVPDNTHQFIHCHPVLSFINWIKYGLSHTHPFSTLYRDRSYLESTLSSNCFQRCSESSFLLLFISLKLPLLKRWLCSCVFVFQVAELEAQLGHPAAGQPDKEELSRSLEELEALLRAKDQASPQVLSLHCMLSTSICHLIKENLRVESNPGIQPHSWDTASSKLSVWASVSVW